MPASMYDYTIPPLLRGLGVLQSYLDKMQATVDSGRFTGEELLQARLADDMLPLGRQFQIASDNAKNGPARLAGQEAPCRSEELGLDVCNPTESIDCGESIHSARRNCGEFATYTLASNG